MKVLLDTSVVVAALLPTHPSHGAAVTWLSRAKADAYEFLLAAHSLAELYAVLTRLPVSPRISPEAAGRLIQENILSAARILALSVDEYVALVDGLIDKPLAGGAV